MKRKQSKIFNSKNMPYMILFLLLGTVMGTTVTSEYIMLYDNVWVLRIDGTVVLNNSDNNVNIGENESTDYKLKVNGTTHLNGTVNVSGDIIPFSSNVYNLGGPGLCWNNLFINNITSCNDVLNITSNTNIKENLTVTNNISCGNLTVTNNINLNNLSLENISVNNITEFTTGYGIHLINDTYVSTDLDVGDRLDVGGDVVVVDDIWCDVAYTRMVGINSSVYHRGDPDTFMYYNDNEVYFTVEGNKTLQITSYLVEIWRNLTVHGNITADENITAKYFIGNGSGLWGINVSNITGNITFENISANNFTQYNDYGIHFLHNVTLVGNRTIKATETLTLGEDGLITIGSNIERDMYPLFDLKVNLGNSTHRFNDFFMGGNLNGNDSDAYFKNLTVGDNIYSENISCNNFSKYNDYGIHFLDDVNILGSLNVTNNITGNFFYAEARYHYRLGMALNFVQNVYYNITFNSSDNINGFTWDGDSNLTCNKAGLYSINFQSSGDGVNNHQYYLSVGINHVYQEELESPKKLNSGGDILTMSGTGFIRLAENDVVSLMMVDVTGNGAGTYYGSNLNLVRIGD